MPQVSVLIPAFNNQKTIGRAIRSVLSQTFQDFDVIIVDDGSRDATVQEIGTFTDPRIKIIRHPKNLGEAEARNTAVREASSELIAFLDADDEWLETKLAQQVEYHLGHPACAANVSGYILFDEFNIRRQEIPTTPPSWYKHLLMGCGLAPGTTLLTRRNVFSQVGGYDPSLPRYTDWDWMLRFSKIFSISVTPLPLAVVYRSTSPKAAIVEQAAHVFLSKNDNDFTYFGSYGRRAKGKRYLEVAIYYFNEGNKKDGKRLFKMAMQASLWQRPGMYLRVVDGIMGTSMVPALIRAREAISGHKR